MTREEMNEALGATEEELDAIAAEYENDTWDETTLIPPSSTTPETHQDEAI